LNIGGTAIFNKVGIGIQNPGAKLDVNGGLRVTGFQMSPGGTLGRVLTSDSSGVGTWQSLPPTNWGTNGIDLYNLNVGNVGIGTTNPGTALEVNGTTRTNGFQMSPGASEGRILISDDSGNGRWQDPNFAGRANRAYRWNTFNTYDQNGWAMGNDPTLFGGVPPSSWTDGNATADMISQDHDVQRALFTQRATFGPNVLVLSDSYVAYSSTNGKVVVCLFRVKNTTQSELVWTPTFNYTAYLPWSETASCAVNGTLVWSSGSTGQVTVPLPIPANSTSSVIFVATSGNPINTGSALFVRSTQLGFVNNCLNLPEGLEFVDDFDTAP
jgi:hypothetical protein